MTIDSYIDSVRKYLPYRMQAHLQERGELYSGPIHVFIKTLKKRGQNPRQAASSLKHTYAIIKQQIKLIENESI